MSHQQNWDPGPGAPINIRDTSIIGRTVMSLTILESDGSTGRWDSAKDSTAAPFSHLSFDFKLVVVVVVVVVRGQKTLFTVVS